VAGQADCDGQRCHGDEASSTRFSPKLSLGRAGAQNVGGNCRIFAVQGVHPIAETQFSDIYLWMSGIDPG